MIDKLNGCNFGLKMMIYWKNIILFRIKSAFDSKPDCNKEFLKIKIKSHGNEVTDFYNKKISKVDSNHTCLVVISLDSALKRDDNYYRQVFLEECKYTKKKVVRYIHHDLSDFSYSFDESDEELTFFDKFLLLAHKCT